MHVILVRSSHLGRDQQWAIARDVFPQLVAESNLHLWKPGDPVAGQGGLFLIGAAIWSGYDMQLLDSLDEVVARGKIGSDRLDVFDFDVAVSTQEALERYVPGVDIQTVFGPPIVGYWENGVLTEKGSGHAGRSLIVERYGLRRDLHLDPGFLARVWRRLIGAG